jgi:hypothetical protein
MKRKYRIYFCKDYRFRLIPEIVANRLRWKDKFGTPRCELPPRLEINWLGGSVLFIIGEDEYWEKWLWIKYYNDGDKKKAKETWPWVDLKTRQSTW